MKSTHGAEPLADDDLDILDGRGHQQFDGAGALLFGDQAHADHGDQEEGDGGGEPEQRANDLVVHIHRLLLTHHLGLEAEADEIARGGEEAESEDQAEKRHQQIGDGGCEVTLEFFLADEEYVLHFCLLLLVVGLFAGGELEEDIFQAQADGAEFAEIPTGVDHAAGEFGAYVAALQTLDFEGEAAVLGILHHDAADAGDLFEASLDLVGIGMAVGGFDFERDGFGAAQAVGEVGDGILGDELALANDDDALAGVLHLAEDVGAEDDGVIAGEGLQQRRGFR